MNPLLSEIDFNEFEELFDTDTAMYIDFLDSCIVSINEKKADLQKAIETRDFSIVSEVRHSLMPTFHSLSLHQLNEELFDIDENQAEWPSAIRSLVVTFDALTDRIATEQADKQ